MRKVDLLGAVCLSGMVLALGGPAYAQTEENAIGEIIVTAQHRAESLQDAPVAISAIGGEELQERQITDVLALQSVVPNVQFGQAQAQARLSIRGIGFDTTTPGNEARVAYHLDGVYVSRPGAVLGTLFDVSRVEVLRGPQGTLYGRNATSGTINVLTNGPTDEFEGYLNTTIGNYDLRQVEAAIGGPISDSVSFRLAGQFIDRGGYGDNLTTGEDVFNQHTRAIRGKLRIRPTDDVSITLAADYFTQDDNNGGYSYWQEAGRSGQECAQPSLAVCTGIGNYLHPDQVAHMRNNPFDTFAEFNNHLFSENYGASITLDWDLAPDYTLTSISAYRYTEIQNNWDQDFTSSATSQYTGHDESEQLSQEIRLAHEWDGGHWIVGGYYFSEVLPSSGYLSRFYATTFGDVSNGTGGYYGTVNSALNGCGVLCGPGTVAWPIGEGRQGAAVNARIETEAAAAFAQANFELGQHFSIDVGLRYSWERKEIFNEYNQFDLANEYPPALPIVGNLGFRAYGEASDSAWTPRVTLNFTPNNDILMYVTYAQGFKSGGYNIGQRAPAFLPEEITDIEGGIKADWFDGSLRTNISAFHYDFTEIQVNRVVGTAVTVDNASTAKIYGLEAEIWWMPITNLELNLNAGVLHSEYGTYLTTDPYLYPPDAPADPDVDPWVRRTIDLAGNQLSAAPDYTVDLGAQYTWQTDLGDITLRGEAHFVGDTYYNQFNDAAVMQPAYDRFDAFLNYRSPSDQWTAGLFVRNIEDEITWVAGSRNAGILGNATSGALAPPRTFGVRLGYNF